MLRRNYGSVKSELGRIAGSTGFSTSDSRLLAVVNQATEELMNEGMWPTIVDRLKFDITNRHFVLPSDYDRMLYCTVNGIPQQMQSPWYEFVGFGLELLSPVATPDSFLYPRYQGVLDKDEVATFRDIPDDGTVYYPRVAAQADERVAGVRPVINLQGYDKDNNWVRSPDGTGGFKDGVDIPINGDTAPFWVQSTQSFKYITATTKPVTKENVLLFVVNSGGENQHYIGQYAAGDTTPFYRQYSLPALFWGDCPHARCVLARCLRRFVPIRADADFLLISNLPALKLMVQAVYYAEAKDPDAYAKYKLGAIDLLRKEAKAYIGLQQQKPIMTISEGAGMRGDGSYIL